MVVMDPRDGSIVAMASYPTFDPELFVSGISNDDFDELTDPVVGGLYTGLFIPVLHFLMEWVFHQGNYRNNQISMTRVQRN